MPYRATAFAFFLAGFALTGCGPSPASNGANRPPPASSCKQILDANPDIESGEYLIDPDRSGDEFEAFKAECDMETDGGGWTKITPCIAKNKLGATLVAGMEAETEKFDDECRPWTVDDRKHSYHYTIHFPGGIEEFFLKDYSIKNATDTSNDLGFVQTVWVKAFGGESGDISFGSGAFGGPKVSFSREAVSCSEPNCTASWPKDGDVYEFDKRVDNFRIGWGETSVSGPSPDPNPEGWYPWWKGSIWVR